MAPAPAPPDGGGKKVLGLNLSKPGAKEYVIVGGGALALFLIYKWWKNRQAAAASPAGAGGGCTDVNGNPGTLDASGNCISTSSAAAPSTATGLSTSALLAWIQDHSSSTTTTSSGGTTTTPPKAAPGTVPNVTGQHLENAGAALKAAGYVPVSVPARVPKGSSGFVTSQNPAAGSKAAQGTTVALQVRIVKPGTSAPAAPKARA